jgi:REP element-mobilizing transposase RayT
MLSSKPGYSALRKGRFALVGQMYCLTTVTYERQPLFLDFRTARIVINELREIQVERKATTVAFVVMPDHLHWLVVLESDSPSVVMRLLKTRAARKINQLRCSGKPVWQTGFHDRAIRSEENIPVIARYIVRNPVRAGLVPSARSYPHWDCIWI